MTKKDRIIALHRAHPRWSPADLAEEAGCSVSYAKTALYRAGISPLQPRTYSQRQLERAIDAALRGEPRGQA